MSRVGTVIVAACLSFAFTAHAQERRPHGVLRGHPNLVKAEGFLHAANEMISKSQSANECVFRLEGGHGEKAKEAIVVAEREVWEASEWVNTHPKDCDAYHPGRLVTHSPPMVRKVHNLVGHPNMVAAERDLIGAYDAVVRSQDANECAFGLEGGHGQKAREAIDVAYRQVVEAAEWVNTHEKECRVPMRGR